MTTQGGRGRGWIHGSGRDLIRGGLGGGDAGGGGLTCKGAGAGVLVQRHGGGEGGRMGGGGGGLAHASRLTSEEPKISRRRDSRAGGRGSAPGLMPRGFLPRGKRREAGRNSASHGLPKALQIDPGKLAPADFSHREFTGNPAGNLASKLALSVTLGSKMIL